MGGKVSGMGRKKPWSTRARIIIRSKGTAEGFDLIKYLG
jgi:hypothetical protein